MNRREFLAAAAAAPLLLRPSALGAGNGSPLALVTADTESRVVGVDPRTGRVRVLLETLPGPRSIEAVAGRAAVVAHTSEGAVSIVDADPLAVRLVLRAFDEPRYTAARRDGRHAYVTDSGRGDVAIVDMRRGRVVRRLALGGPARHVSLSPDAATLWVSLGSKAEAIAVVDVRDPAHPRLGGRLRPPFLAHDVGFAPGGERVWVTSGDRGRLAVYDARTLQPLFTLQADAPPQHVTFAGSSAFVTSGDDGTLRVHALPNGRLVRTTRVPVGSYNVQQGPAGVLTPSLERGTLCILDERGHLVHRVQAARSSHDACFVVARSV